MPELESRLEAFFVQRVRLVGGTAIKVAPTVRGVPDRLVLLPGGRMYLIELKAENGRLSEAQKLWHSRVAELGIEVTTLTGRADVITWLRRVAAAADELAGL